MQTSPQFWPRQLFLPLPSAHTLKKVNFTCFYLVFLTFASFPSTQSFSYLIQGTIKAYDSIWKWGRNWSVTLLYWINGLQKGNEAYPEQEPTPRCYPLQFSFTICKFTALSVYLLRPKSFLQQYFFNKRGFFWIPNLSRAFINNSVILPCFKQLCF